MTSAQEVWELSRAVLGDQDGMIAVLKVYMDESGTHDGSPVLTVGAYIAKPKVWRGWTKAWNVAKRPINVFHSVDCANLKEEFEGWTEPDRDALVVRLLSVIAGSDLGGVVIGIHMDEFKAALAERYDLQRLFGTPYIACFQWVVQTILESADKFGDTQRIAFFHEINDFQIEAFETFNWLRANKNAAARKISLAFGTKDDYSPLQAADVLAYEGNKRFRDVSRPERRSWAALDPRDRITARYFGAKNAPQMISLLEAGSS